MNFFSLGETMFYRKMRMIFKLFKKKSVFKVFLMPTEMFLSVHFTFVCFFFYRVTFSFSCTQ